MEPARPCGAGARDDAMAAFERAAELVPRRLGPPAREPRWRRSPSGRATSPRLRELKALLADDHTNIEAARRLVPLARRLGDQGALALAFDRIVTLDPFDSATHSAYGRLAWERRDMALAAREFRAAVDSGPVDPVPAQCDLAEALLVSGERAEAKQVVLAPSRLPRRTSAPSSSASHRRRQVVMQADAGAGSQSTYDELFPLVYAELRRIAAREMRREKPGRTLQTTALVHEAYLRLLKDASLSFENRAHFLGIAARACARS